MALDTYTHLQTAVLKWLNRENDTDLAAQLPDHIALAEARMKRLLRRSETRTDITIDGEAVNPPSDMAELRSIYLISSSPERDMPIRIVTAEMLAERRARNAGSTGRPSDVSYIAGQLLFAPTPDQTYTAEIIYFTQLTPLSNSVTTNAVLQEAPDAYLFGTLLELAPYLEYDDKIPIWKEKFEQAIQELNDVRDREQFAASLRSVRLPIVFGGN